jgi:hypothetical protein
VTKPIQPLHYHTISPLFAILFYFIYFCCIAYFQSADRLENKPSENFQDLDFEDLEQQQPLDQGKYS